MKYEVLQQKKPELETYAAVVATVHIIIWQHISSPEGKFALKVAILYCCCS
jgi:hypothetical protein